MEIDRVFFEKLINNMINSKPQPRACSIRIELSPEHIKKLNSYIRSKGISFFRLFTALLREYAEDEETRAECLKYMPIQYESKFLQSKVIHMSRDAFDLLALESQKIRMDRQALSYTLLCLFIDKIVKFKSEKLLDSILFERLI